MGTIFTLDSQIKSVIQDALDDLITELGKDCKLVYPPKWSECLNCITPYDPIGQKPSCFYRQGGPVPFGDGICPVCNGAGKQSSEVSEVLKFLCEWNPQKFIRPVSNLNIQIPYSLVQTKGYLTDLPKVLQADHLIFQVPIEGLMRKRYRLASEPGDPSNIIQNRYFVALWQRAD